MKIILTLRSFIVLISALLSASFLLFYDFGKSNSHIIDSIINFGHLPLFGLVALVFFWLFKQATGLNEEYLKSWTITCLIGVLTECIQALIPYRHFRVGDMYTDALGAAVFLTLLFIARNGLKSRYVVLIIYGLSLLVLIRAYPIFEVTMDTWNMKHCFPLLSSFESSFEMSRFSYKDKTMDRVELHATEGKYSLKVTLNPSEYPGISMDYLQNDWRGYLHLSFDTFVEGYAPLDITVRVNDRKHNNEYTDRFNKRFHLLPGANHITIGLKDIITAPKGRIMDMADITNICIFAHRLKEQRTVYFDNFRLENRG
jgi:VanZ family protein